MLALVAIDLVQGEKRLPGCRGEVVSTTHHDPLELHPGGVGTDTAENVDEHRRRCVGSEPLADQWHCTVSGLGKESGRDRLLVLAAVVDGTNQPTAGRRAAGQPPRRARRQDLRRGGRAHQGSLSATAAHNAAARPCCCQYAGSLVAPWSNHPLTWEVTLPRCAAGGVKVCPPRSAMITRSRWTRTSTIRWTWVKSGNHWVWTGQLSRTSRSSSAPARVARLATVPP